MTSLCQAPFVAMGTYSDWLVAWKEWARTRKRGKMAQFIVEKLEENKQARWLNIAQGKFELTEWHDIAKEWFKEKPRNSDQVDAPCMLRKGLPRAFPGLEEVKSESVKEGTQYRSRVFIATPEVVQEVMMYIQNGRGLVNAFPPPSSSGYHPYQPQHPTMAQPSPPMPNGVSTPPSCMHGSIYHHSVGNPQVKIEDGRYIDSPVPSVASETQSPFLQPVPYNIPTSQIPGPLDPSLDHLADQIVNRSPGADPSVYADPNTYSVAEGSPYQNQPPQEMLQLPGPTEPQEGGWISPSHSPHSHQSPHSYHSHHSPRYSPDSSEMGGAVFSPAMAMQMNPQALPNQMGAVTSPPHQPPPSSLNVKVVPDSSPLEGGGQMVLVFYNDLPPGNKFVMFISRQRNNQITVETTQENSMVLYALIPRHEIPETVILQVYCEGCVLAQSEFTYYANTQYNSDQLFHYLVQNMPQYFQMDDVPGAMGGMGGGGAGGGGGGGSYGYYGNIPASTYGLLLGACRLGLEPLVYHTLQINSMSKISGEQLQKAYSCCHEYGHQNLSDCLKHLVRFTSFVSRDPSQESPMGEGLQKTLSKLDSGGEDPLATSHKLLSVMLESSKQAKSIPSPSPSPSPHSSPPPSTTATTTTPHTSTSTTSTLPSPSQQSRRLSSTKLQKQDSVKDPDDDLSDIHPHAVVSNPIGGGGGGGGEREKLKDTLLSRGSSLGLTSVRHSVDQELQDSLHPLPRERFSMRGKKGHLISAHSDDNDSAVSMSFDRSFEDHDLQREIERRMSGTFASSGLFSLNLSDTEKAVDIAIDPAASYTFAHSLQYECVFMVTEDYPSGEEKTIFRTGDRILAVGDTSVRGKGPDDFQELLENESSEGTTVKILPRMERSPPPSLSLSLGSSLEAPEKKLHRRQSEQQMLDAITMKVTNLLSMKASRKPRSVVIPSSPEGFGFKVIGGNAVGLFVSEVKPGQKEVSQGDQILEINGQDARHMTHFEATQLLRSTRGKVHLTVMDNGAKFTTIRDQFEFDSFYLRTLVDNKDLQLKSNTLMRVVNTFLYSGNQWLAWVVDEHGTDCELRKIPSPSRAKRICGKEVYQEVNQPYRAPSPMLHPQGLETTVA